MYTAFELSLSIDMINGREVHARRARATRDWVRAACEDAGEPDWLINWVVYNVERAILRGDWPLLPE